MSIIKNFFKRIFKRTKEYVIVTNRDLVRDVREFAEKHCAEGCEVDIHVHGCLLEDDNLVTITFESEEDIVNMIPNMFDAFWDNYKLAIRRKLIFVFKKEEETESE